ncbi:MAG: DNA polymerase III subunit gamma/tau [Burkholderiales bacterium]|nr:DNA polymerase III subunit gamma/tau [Burkholderiales bacterium]
MAHQVLARKWRPRRFEDVVGQDHVVRALGNALQTGRIHHAYLFTGTRGVGKTTLARILAKALNCRGADGQGGITANPCGVCEACHEIDAGRFVDLLEVDAATNTKVDEMRELLETAQYMPVSGRYKVYIIDEVHMLSRSAFNAMLKTLEEPPGHVQFILATTDPQKLPVTVLSRCIQFNLKQLPPAMIAGHLTRVLEAEGVPNEPAALHMLGQAAQGSVRDSLSLLDQAIAYGAGQVTAAGVSGMLGALDDSALVRIVDALARRDARTLLAEVDAMAARSYSFETALRELAALFQRLAVAQSAADNTDLPESLWHLGQPFSATELQVLYQVAIVGRRDLYLAPDEQAGITMSLLRMLTLLGSAGRVDRAAEDRSSAAVSVSQGKVSAAPSASLPAQPATPIRTPAATTSVSPQMQAEVDSAMAANFDGDWPGLVRKLNLPSLSGMLARHCELVSIRDGVLVLLLPDTQKHLAERVYQDKLREALEPVFGKGLRLVVEIGEPRGHSVAAADTRLMNDRQSAAEQSIRSDDFVNGLIRELGAEVNPASIRPSSDSTAA